MTGQRKRAIGIVSVAAVFLVLFLSASGLSWRLVLLASAGMTVIAAALVVTIHLVEANDAKAAAANLARNRAVEADRVQRQRWEAKL